MKRHILKWKQAQLVEIKNLVSKHKVIAIADLENFPAALFQVLRKKLKGKAVIKVSKTRVIKKALEEANLKAPELLSLVSGSLAIIFTEMDSFELYGFLKRSKGSVSAKEGMLAPQDIMIPAGDTGLPPGPALSDLKAAGLNVRVQGATIAIAQDKIVAKKGEAISKPVAGVLSKLNIKPIKVGLNIIACYENSQLFKPEVLDIDSEQVFNDIVKAVRSAVNLSVEAVYPTKETIELIIAKAVLQAMAVEELAKQNEKKE
ncbi:MAG TPA: 50S ribosomal protein L10 [archaeon]|nr:50S ribosomal protein L10 [archaeon]